MRTFALCLLALPLLVAQCGGSDDPFEETSFAAAIEKARSSERVVMVDFFTTWCGPCKKLDQTTWSDASVREWLAKNTVALKIDAEKEVELAKRFNVAAYPTILFVKADGEELDRIVGYREPKQFLSEAGDALGGKDALTRARENFTGHENEPRARMELAGVLANKGLQAEALEHYLWCFDHGLEQDPQFNGVRGSFLLGYIAQLAKNFPPARAAMIERRDRAELGVLGGMADPQLAADMVALNRQLGETEKSLTVFDRLVAQTEQTKEQKKILKRLGKEMGPGLVASKRYAPYLDTLGDPMAALAADIGTWKQFQEWQRANPDKVNAPGEPNPADFLKASAVKKGADLYEALLGTKRTEEAGKVLETTLGLDSSGPSFAALIERAIRAEDPAAAQALLERAKTVVAADEMKKVERAARRKPEAKGG